MFDCNWLTSTFEINLKTLLFEVKGLATRDYSTIYPSWDLLSILL